MKGDLDQVSFQPPPLELYRGRKRERARMRERDGEKDARVSCVCVYQHARPRAARVRHVSVCIRILTGGGQGRAGKNGVAAARESPLARSRGYFNVSPDAVGSAVKPSLTLSVNYSARAFRGARGRHFSHADSDLGILDKQRRTSLAIDMSKAGILF